MTAATFTRKVSRGGRPLSDSPGAIRSRRWRALRDRHKAMALVEFGDDIVDMLVRCGWLADHEVAAPREIGDAIAAMLNEAARR